MTPSEIPGLTGPQRRALDLICLGGVRCERVTGRGVIAGRKAVSRSTLRCLSRAGLAHVGPGGAVQPGPPPA